MATNGTIKATVQNITLSLSDVNEVESGESIKVYVKPTTIKNLYYRYDNNDYDTFENNELIAIPKRYEINSVHTLKVLAEYTDSSKREWSYQIKVVEGKKICSSDREYNDNNGWS